MRIKEAIKENGLMVAQVAHRMGITSPALSRVINGNPTVEMLERVAKAIGIPASSLLDKPSAGNITCPACGADIKLAAEKV